MTIRTFDAITGHALVDMKRASGRGAAARAFAEVDR